MPSFDTVNEAERIMRICNACRYCEGFCAVFPAMELRREFSEGDLTYLANLCHECRGCYYACQYAPPHEFSVNVPRTLATLRAESYRDFCWPQFLNGLFRRNGRTMSLIAIASVAIVTLLVLAARDFSDLFAARSGEGSFYAVIPYRFMVIPAVLMLGFAMLALVRGTLRFWREIGGTWREIGDGRAFMTALRQTLSMRFMKGGGDGCNYPSRHFSHRRRRLHHLVFYGFFLDLAATTVAAVYEHGFGWVAPYSLTSLPVVLGTLGGIGLLFGSLGLIRLKLTGDTAPADPGSRGGELAFMIILAATSLTGLLLLALRETPIMGIMLAVHLGFVAAFFFSIPYGKLVHASYRFLALMRNAIEQRNDAALPAPSSHADS